MKKSNSQLKAEVVASAVKRREYKDSSKVNLYAVNCPSWGMPYSFPFVSSSDDVAKTAFNELCVQFSAGVYTLVCVGTYHTFNGRIVGSNNPRKVISYEISH